MSSPGWRLGNSASGATMEAADSFKCPALGHP
jgi:hypothetical protein